MKKQFRTGAAALLIALLLFLCACTGVTLFPSTQTETSKIGSDALVSYTSLQDIPDFSGDPYVTLQENLPAFTDKEKQTRTSFETYAPLDDLGRCGVCYACIGQDLMPDGERGAIGQLRPTGWHTVKYSFVDGKYLYNRCHLIGWQLSGENANPQNLITGTRYLNVDGMLPLENLVAGYVKQTGGHVLYRVTPIFDGDDLLARGVEMEAWSVEDEGEGVCFHVFCYNAQPGVEIDYATGESRKTDAPIYILNTNTLRFHDTECPLAASIASKNREISFATREELTAQGYVPCGSCNP